MIASLFKNRIFLLFIIVLIGIFYRVFHVYEWMLYGHDQDLAAWIVKDMVVDGHSRLIGQETSITGLFIGGLYYYGLVPFYLLLQMHPIGSMPLPIIISTFTVLSIYWVFNKLFGIKVGLLGAFLYAVSINFIGLDRWSVPTQPTILWSVWFLYVLFSLGRGNIKPFPILLILIGLIWHIHIAFLPLLILIPFGWYLSKKNFIKEFNNVSWHWFIAALGVGFLLILPLIIFEFRHGFQQFFALAQASVEERGAYSGLMRSYLIIQNLGMTMLFPFIYKLIPINYQFNLIDLFRSVAILGLFAGIGWFSLKRKLIERTDGILILIWFAVVFLGQFLTKRAVVEYYFYNLLPLSLLIVSSFLAFLISRKKSKIIVVIFLGIYALANFFYFTTQSIPQREYYYIEQTIKFIKADAEKHGYDCLGLNFFGEGGLGGGFRYPVWYYNVPVVRAGGGIPNYNIAVPVKSGGGEVNSIFGDFGVILPDRNKQYDFNQCESEEKKLLEPNGFVK